MQLRAPITDTGNLEQCETPACGCVQRPPLNSGNRAPSAPVPPVAQPAPDPGNVPVSTCTQSVPPATPVSNVPVDTKTHQRSGPHQWRLRHSPMTIARLHPADDSNDPSPCLPDATPPCPLLDLHGHGWLTTWEGPRHSPGQATHRAAMPRPDDAPPRSARACPWPRMP